MEDIRFQIKLPGCQGHEDEEGDKNSEVSKKNKGDKRSKQGEARGSPGRCDRCCYSCLLCCESVYFTVGSAIRILMSVVVVGLMFWTALYVYTIISKNDKKEDSKPVGRSGSLDDIGGLEANGGLPGGSGDLHKTGSGFGNISESGGSLVTSVDKYTDSPRGGGSDNFSAPSGSSDSHLYTCSEKSCHDDLGCVKSGGPGGGPGDSSDNTRDSADLGLLDAVDVFNGDQGDE